jgi:hypothetical protein
MTGYAIEIGCKLTPAKRLKTGRKKLKKIDYSEARFVLSQPAFEEIKHMIEHCSIDNAQILRHLFNIISISLCWALEPL